MDIQFKPKVLKFAPVWKRVSSFLIDSFFLLTFLSLLITFTYGDELAKVYQTVKNIGGMQLILEEGIFTSQLDMLRQSPKNVQDFIYIQNYISTRYFYLIFVYFQILSIGYYAFFWRFTGQTLGAFAFNIRVIATDASPLGFSSCLLRSIVLKLYEYVYYLPLIVVINPILHQRLHDKISKTVVIENKDWEEMAEEISKLLEKEENKLHENPPPKDKDN